MIKRKLIWQIFPSYLVTLLLSLLAVTWFASGSFRDFYLDQTSKDLEARARLIEKQIRGGLSPLDAAKIDALCKNYGRSSFTRVTVILPLGRVVGDSDEDPDQMESHSTRKEVLMVKKGKTGRSIRYSRTLEQNMMYVAIPIQKEGALQAILRTSIPITSLDKQLRAIWGRLVLSGLLIAILAAGISLWLARRISRPIEEMKSGALRFAQGHLEKMPVPETEEMAGLAEAMNRMANELDQRINTIVRQRNELETVLSSMVEGVMAIDMNERVMSMNASALKMFEVDPEHSYGRNIQEVIRNSALIKFIAKALSHDDIIQEDITFYNHEERIYSVHNSPIYDADNQMVGTLVVVEDVTKLRKLENMRKDFVANASHEIRTPLTTIKGFVETLQNESASLDSEKAKRFLDIILKHVDRLNDIIQDLLSLSRVEREKETGGIILSDGNVKDVINTAVGLCQPKADEKNIQIVQDVEENMVIPLDATLLEQAIVNLLDNAVKYSNENSKIEIHAGIQKGDVVIQIKDHGIGIPKEHLPRLFERFYRVDKARSRKMGGTGLGLSIVKHIISAHNGIVDAQSIPGKGSTFILQIPAKKVQHCKAEQW